MQITRGKVVFLHLNEILNSYEIVWFIKSVGTVYKILLFQGSLHFLSVQLLALIDFHSAKNLYKENALISHLIQVIQQY